MVLDNADDLASRLYRLLRQHGEWPADRLAAALDVSPDALSKGLDELEQMGLVRRGTAVWTTIDPMLALEQVLTDHSRAITEWTNTAGRLASDVGAMVARMPALRAAVDDVAMNTVLEGNETARSFLAELGESLQHELLAVHAGGALTQAAIDAALPQDLAVLERGVQVRTIYQSSAVRSVATRTYLERLDEAGAVVRIRDTLPFRMVLADGSTAVCSMRRAAADAAAARRRRHRPGDRAPARCRAADLHPQAAHAVRAAGCGVAVPGRCRGRPARPDLGVRGRGPTRET